MGFLVAEILQTLQRRARAHNWLELSNLNDFVSDFIEVVKFDKN